MMKKTIRIYLITTMLSLLPLMLYGQLGVRVGVNTSSENFYFDYDNLRSSFNTQNLSGYQAGLIYQYLPQKTGLGFELGALLSQKGASFSINNSDIYHAIINGYHEINYVDVPLNLKMRFNLLGFVSAFASGGVFGSYALDGKTVFETDWEDVLFRDSFDGFMDRIDYGYSFGGGVELVRKLQLALNWSGGLQKRDENSNIGAWIDLGNGVQVPNIRSQQNTKMMSITLTYLF